ncbi:hypothetical protein Tco_1369335 [Tanacetum coccineum]
MYINSSLSFVKPVLASSTRKREILKALRLHSAFHLIQNRNSKKRVTKGKDGVYRVLPPTTQEEQVADEKERKARTLLLMAVPKDHLRRFHGMDDAKEIWAAIKTRSNPKTSFLRSLPPAWDSLAMTMRTKKNIDTLSIDDLYNNLSVFEQDIQKTSSSSLTSDNVAFLSQAKASSSKHKSSHNSGSYSSYTTSSSKATPTATPATNADDVDLIHDDLDQIDDLDLEEMDINWQIAMTAIKIKKFYKKTGSASLKVQKKVAGRKQVEVSIAMTAIKIKKFYKKTGRRPRCKFKSSKDGSKQEASRGQDFKPVRTEKEALMTIDEGQINWVEQTEDEELNHALMAFTVNNELVHEFSTAKHKLVLAVYICIGGADKSLREGYCNNHGLFSVMNPQLLKQRFKPSHTSLMANLEFCDKHNMVAFLQKSTGSEEFHQIVDFLADSHIRYALTANPTIYASLIKQFWQTATIETVNNGEQQLSVTVDVANNCYYEVSVRRHLQ